VNLSYLILSLFRKRLHQLPDKGKRLQESYDKLLAEIRRRDEVEEATRMLSGLNIVEKGKIALNNLEWNGRNTDEGEDCRSTYAYLNK